MSFRVAGKMLRCFGISAFLWFAMPTVSWAQQFGSPSAAPCGVSCGVGCQTHHCPPAFKYCYEGAPRIHWTRGCPHPICNPCDLPHFGYFETCWSPPPPMWNWGHCPTPPPAAYVQLHPMMQPHIPSQRSPAPLPYPSSTVPVPGAAPYPMPMPMPMPNGPPEELPFPRGTNGQRQ